MHPAQFVMQLNHAPSTTEEAIGFHTVSTTLLTVMAASHSPTSRESS
ncbi:hypothetical protein An11g02740 [Aspergillus niger]|uniref:Uncharacterized protein n=2 Tax=Aspergillus niger TaxID=5061 RepID=A2QVV1_ASPNC|nr:hypothetical protein An11g02740 [Aspergillus niger]CAK96903.1 hypothetical protein An11g02740 [Aspergillus niger]